MLFCQQLPLERCFAGRVLLQRICIWAKAAGPCRCRQLRLGRANGLSPWEDGGVLESWRCLMTYRKYVLLFPDQDINQDTPLTRAFCGDGVGKDIMDAARVLRAVSWRLTRAM